jgi:hypothetical protein
MTHRTKILMYLSLLILIDTLPLPLPVTALILLYIVLQKPLWFYDAVQRLYS